jgi:hypothetical protein
MNPIERFVVAGLVTLALAGGCDDHDHAPATQGAAAGDAHGHDHGHDHSHGEETREALGLEKAGPYDVAPVQLGKVKPGGQLAFDVEILGDGQPKPKAVRFWIGGQADAVAMVPAESEKDNVYHVDLPVPQTMPPELKLWIEVEPPTGPAQTASFALK